MLSGDNSILQKATDAKQTSERADAKEQAQLDILAWQSDKISKGENSDLDDTIIQGILTEKSYVKSADATSFTTSKGEYVIPYSELYQPSQNNSTPVAIIDESEKLKNYCISNDFTDAEVNELNTELDGNIVKYAFYGDEDEKSYITYNGKLYKVTFESSECKVTNVEFVMALSTFSEQQIAGVDVLITPGSPENLIHSSYDGLSTFSNMYCLKNNGDLDLSKPFTSGYVTYDNNGDVDGYYDNNGILVSVVEVEGPETFTNLYYFKDNGEIDLDRPFTEGYYDSINGNYYDISGVFAFKNK